MWRWELYATTLAIAVGISTAELLHQLVRRRSAIIAGVAVGAASLISIFVGFMLWALIGYDARGRVPTRRRAGRQHFDGSRAGRLRARRAQGRRGVAYGQGTLYFVADLDGWPTAMAVEERAGE